jgi:hypothetical protein
MYLYGKKSPNDIKSGNFDSEKVDEEGIFYVNFIFYFFNNISSNEWHRYLDIPKIIFVVSRALKLYFLFLIFQIFISFEVIIFPIKNCR